MEDLEVDRYIKLVIEEKERLFGKSPPIRKLYDLCSYGNGAVQEGPGPRKAQESITKSLDLIPRSITDSWLFKLRASCKSSSETGYQLRVPE
jgi:hypothetical protein